MTRTTSKTPAAFGRRLDIPGGRRKGDRNPVRLAASLQALNCSRPVTLLDLSKAGARMSMPEPMYAGQQVWLKAASTEMFGTVRWVKDNYCGIVFDTPLNSRELALLEAKGKVVMIRGLSREERMDMAMWKDAISPA